MDVEPVEAGEQGGNEEASLEDQVACLEASLADLQARLPAHSIPASMMARMDELEEALAEARARLGRLRAGPGPSERS